MFTVYNLCSVNWEIFSTSGDVQYMGGYHEYIGACFSTWGDIMITLGHVQYIRGYHYECGRIPCLHQGMFSTSEKYHQYMGGGGGNIMSTLGDVQHIRWIS